MRKAASTGSWRPVTNAFVCEAMPTTARKSEYCASVIPFARAAASTAKTARSGAKGTATAAKSRARSAGSTAKRGATRTRRAGGGSESITSVAELDALNNTLAACSAASFGQRMQHFECERAVKLYWTHYNRGRGLDNYVSAIGSLFEGRVEAIATVGGHSAIRPSIAGWARMHGLNTILVDERDPFRHGFQVN